jgi:hypothetical protein
MIQADPADPANYALIKLYEDAGAYPEASRCDLRQDVKPNDSAGYMQLAGFYNRQGSSTRRWGARTARHRTEQSGSLLHDLDVH